MPPAPRYNAANSSSSGLELAVNLFRCNILYKYITIHCSIHYNVHYNIHYSLAVLYDVN